MYCQVDMCGTCKNFKLIKKNEIEILGKCSQSGIEIWADTMACDHFEIDPYFMSGEEWWSQFEGIDIEDI